MKVSLFKKNHILFLKYIYLSKVNSGNPDQLNSSWQSSTTLSSWQSSTTLSSWQSSTSNSSWQSSTTNSSWPVNTTNKEITSFSPTSTQSLLVTPEASSGLDFYLTVYVSSMGLIVLLMICKGFIGATVSFKIPTYQSSRVQYINLFSKCKLVHIKRKLEDLLRTRNVC